MGVFARVLQEVLEAHQDTDYSYLGGQEPRNDPLWHPLRRLAIAPEVISRLKAAAISNDKRATLNPDDFAYVCEQLRFTASEQTKLRAALLAQGVEMFLRDRMSVEEASAADTITTLVYQQLLERFEEPFHQVRGNENPFAVGDEMEGALRLIDRANYLLQAARLAETNGVKEEAAFWRTTSATAYDMALGMLEPNHPDLAAEIRRRLAQP